MNSLWISSLVISITSALLATLIQQWTRRYVRLTEPHGFAHKRARIRLHLFDGVSNLHFLLATDAVPTLLHLSVFLFFAGLLTLLWHINHTVFNAVVGWVVLCAVVYLCITFLPFYRPDSPHYAPISSLAWQLYTDVLHPLFRRLSPVTGILNMDTRPAERLLSRVEEKAAEIVWKESPKLDAKILDSLLANLGDDAAQEKFLKAIPGFYDSQVVHVQDVNNRLTSTFFTNFRHTINQFVVQTLTSESVSESVRSCRLLSCLKATQSVLGERAGKSITDKLIRSGSWDEMPPSSGVVHILRRWRNSTDPSKALIGRCIIARIIAGVEKHDDAWMALARSQLGVTEEVFKVYLEHGDSVLLANLIETTRLFIKQGLQFQGILHSIADFDVTGTLPELQHEFCALWNEMVEKSKQCGNCWFILDEICHVHAALHPTVPTTVAAPPTSTTANNDSLFLGPAYALCTDRQSHPPHHPPSVAVATSPPSSHLGVPHLSPPLQRDEISTNPHSASDTTSFPEPLTPLRAFPVEIRTHVPPALGHSYSNSYSTTTSYALPTPRDASFSDPGILVVGGERDVQYNPHQSDPAARDITIGTSPSGKGGV